VNHSTDVNSGIIYTKSKPVNGKRLQSYWKALTGKWQALTFYYINGNTAPENGRPSMTRPENLLLAAALAVFSIFFVNVTLGAMRLGVFLSDSSEMLILFLACVLFVIATVRCEISKNSKNHR
jgi:hypothetical protein